MLLKKSCVFILRVTVLMQEEVKNRSTTVSTATLFRGYVTSKYKPRTIITLDGTYFKAYY